MAEPFLGEIRLFSFNFAPQGWAMCNGQFLPINQNQALFSLMGTMYGGNGHPVALPDLRDRVPIHVGSSFVQGQTGGEDAHTLTQSEMPTHSHVLNAKNPPDGSTNVNNPVGNFLSNSAPNEMYQAGGGNPPLLALASSTLSNVGGSQAHENQQPYLTINFCVALQGIFPSRN